MKKHISTFKDPAAGIAFLEEWNRTVQQLNQSWYDKLTVNTFLGKTVVWAYNKAQLHLEALVIFPGARTCGLFWDMDNALAVLKQQYRIFIVDVNGQASLSDGRNPDIKTDEYGRWAAEVLTGLQISYASVAGASLGGLICMKLCLYQPSLVKQAILLNPAGIRAFSTSPKNLFYNIWPLIAPSRKSVGRFLDKAILHAPQHILPEAYKKLLIDYELYVIKNFRFRGDYPAAMSKAELRALRTDINLILGDKDILFPYQDTMHIAKENIPALRKIKVLPDTGHGIETSKAAIQEVADMLKGDASAGQGK